MKTLDVLGSIKIASPCHASWDAMAGDERVRYCGECRLHVYNFSGMAREEIDALMREKEGRLCVRLFRRTDGTVLTADCAVGAARVRRRWAVIGGIVATLLALIGAGAFAKREEIASGTRNSSLRRIQPFKAVLGWLFPIPPPQVEMGSIPVPTPSNGPAEGSDPD